MANQPQSRPWFRLPTIARVAQPAEPASAPAPPPAPQPPNQPPIPRPAFLRPAFRPTTATQQPPQQLPQQTIQEASAPPSSSVLQAPAPLPSALSRPPPFITPDVPPLSPVTLEAPSSPPTATVSSPISITPPPPTVVLPTTPAPKGPTPPPSATSSPPSAIAAPAPGPSTLVSQAVVKSPLTAPIDADPTPPSPSIRDVSSPQKARDSIFPSPRTVITTPTSPISPVISQKSPQTTSRSSPPISSPKSHVTSQRSPPSTTSPSSSASPPAAKASPILPIVGTPLSPSFTKSEIQRPPSVPFPPAPRQAIPLVLAKPASSSPKQVAVSRAPVASQSKLSNGSGLITAAPAIARVRTPIASPREATNPLRETPPQTPKTKTSLTPPSPFTLPPSQLRPEGETKAKFPAETEKKTVVVQQSPKQPKSNSESHKPSSKGRDTHQKSSNDETTVGMGIITITGENHGAIMELGYSHTRKPRAYTLRTHDKVPSSTQQGRDLSNSNENRLSPKMAANGVLKRAMLNSNVQGVNNSILFNSILSYHDPGLHLSLSRKPINDYDVYNFQSEDHANGSDIFSKETKTSIDSSHAN